MHLPSKLITTWWQLKTRLISINSEMMLSVFWWTHHRALDWFIRVTRLVATSPLVARRVWLIDSARRRKKPPARASLWCVCAIVSNRKWVANRIIRCVNTLGMLSLSLLFDTLLLNVLAPSHEDEDHRLAWLIDRPSPRCAHERGTHWAGFSFDNVPRLYCAQLSSSWLDFEQRFGQL